MGQGSTASRWLPTWNVSGAWTVDEEEFYPKNDVLSSVRLRGTYGLVANPGDASISSVLLSVMTTKEYPPTEEELAIIQEKKKENISQKRKFAKFHKPKSLLQFR